MRLDKEQQNFIVAREGWAGLLAYQSLNIIGSFTAAAPINQHLISADRERAEAYRSLLRDQVQARVAGNDPLTATPVTEIQADDERLAISDAPEDRRSPYLFQPKRTTQTPPVDTPPEDSVTPHSDENGPGGQLDLLV